MARKKRNVPAANGWSVVAGSSGRSIDSHEPDGDKSPEDQETVSPGRQDPDLDLNRLRKEFEQAQKRFMSSKCRGKLREALRAVAVERDVLDPALLSAMSDLKVAIAQDDHGVTATKELGASPPHRAVCVGLGCLSSEFSHLRRRSLTQLSLFLDLRTTIPNSHKNPIELLAFDPCFNTLDTALLQSLNITPLPTTASADTSLTANSVLFAPFLGYKILIPKYLDRKDLAFYIGNDLREVLDTVEARQTEDEAWGKVKQSYVATVRDFLDLRDGSQISLVGEDPDGLDDLYAYWRRPMPAP